MYTVSQIMGISKNNSRGLVIYLATSPGRKTQSGRTFERMLGILGRDLRAAGGVVVAFPGDEDTVTSDILKKRGTIPKGRPSHGVLVCLSLIRTSTILTRKATTGFISILARYTILLVV